MADRVKLIERIAARGRRKLEKLAEKKAARAAREARPTYVANAKAAAKREALLVEIAALQERRAERAAKREDREMRRLAREARTFTPEEMQAKVYRAARRAQQKVDRAARAQERLASLPAPVDKRIDAVHSKVRGAAKRAEVIRSREAAVRAARLPPLPYRKAPPLPY